VDKGATLCSSPGEVASKADAIFTIVGYPRDVEEVILGPGGILEGLKGKSNAERAGSVVIDMTTSKPDLAVRISEAVKSAGCLGSLDAPVSGGDVGAKEARLAVMVGGGKEAFEKVKGILEVMGNPVKGGKVELVGGPGAGQHTKMTNQILIASCMVGVVEGSNF